MAKEYNIFWIDDEHEALKSFKFQAKDNNIILFPFKSLNSGIADLKKNFHKYDGILLDAKIIENDNDVAGSEDTYFVHRAKEEILKLPKVFDIFVFTGQAEAYNDNTFGKVFNRDRVYQKGTETETERLFTDLKETADKQPDTHIRHNHSRVFDVCTEKYIGEDAAFDILSFLKGEHQNDSEKYFNGIRQIVEDIFKACYKFKLLPKDFVSPSVALNQSSIFLCGKEQNENTDKKYKQYKHLEETHLPYPIANNLQNILSVTQNASHRSSVMEHVKKTKSPYLFKAILYQLLEVIVWFKDYVDSNPTKENWELTDLKSGKEDLEATKDDSVEGTVQEIAENGYGTFKPDSSPNTISIIPKMVKEYNLNQKDRIKVITEKVDNNKTHIKHIQKIDRL
jgi:hypothetical protein